MADELYIAETRGYLAGVLDGEGCVTFGRSNSARKSYVARVLVEVADRLFAEEICRRYATLGIHKQPRKTRRVVRGRERTYWRIDVHKQGAVKCLLEFVVSLLREKQAQAKLVLEFLSRRPLRRCWGGDPRYAYTDRDHAIVAEVAALKRRNSQRENRDPAIPSEAGTVSVSV